MSEGTGGGERLGPIALIRGAAGLVAAKWPAVLGLWALMSALVALPRLVVATAPASADGMRAVTNGEILYTALAPVLMAVVSAMVFRAVLQPPTGRTPEGGAWLYALVIGGLGAVQAVAGTFVRVRACPSARSAWRSRSADMPWP